MDQPRTIIIGISGCSSSGKTTLARLLRDMFPETFILHEDDFYKPESELPINQGHADWDCPEAISIPDLEAALAHVRATGTFPPNVNSIEDLNTVGPCPATPEQIAACAARVNTWLTPGQPGSSIFTLDSKSNANPQETNPNPQETNPNPQETKPKPKPKTRICILDGFLLYSPPPTTTTNPDNTSKTKSPLRTVMTHLDIKLFLRASRASALRRRTARDGYVHMDGFWTDPPGYVEQVVWPNYVEAHRWLFEGGDVEGGRLDGGVLGAEGILAPGMQAEEGGDVEFGAVLEWAVGVVMGELERLCLGEGRG
ncbi:P-loop containing nucleoside triphosphate hydrolase protein [Chaetomium fimeti]|uniref:P-loop containing nucleoside triphosphate hydrolase protein n=1 Tax=Chaetomium fimeti TaxID=1854472 RepID=A0AAE0LUE3_9PEZI|nr:P-loop containing nucleoside triphosphate hydrolase protein [Chaetomium fimeti]